MIEAFRDGGVIMWPLLAIAIGILVMVVRAMAAGAQNDGDVANRRKGILFWGIMAALLGLLGTVVGLLVVAQNIQRAGSVDPALAWSGVGITLISFVFGLLILLFAGGAWLALDAWQGRARARS